MTNDSVLADNVDIVDVENKLVLRMPCFVYSRVVGYLTPVSNWHPAKQQEFRDRVTYDVKERIG